MTENESILRAPGLKEMEEMKNNQGIFQNIIDQVKGFIFTQSGFNVENIKVKFTNLQIYKRL
jgi:hypothetical protein